jgi:hypothetical protein
VINVSTQALLKYKKQEFLIMNFKNKFQIMFLVFLGLIISACSGIDSGLKSKTKGILGNQKTTDETTVTEAEPETGLAPEDTATDIVEVPLSFETIKTLILNDNCINCHTGKHTEFELHALVQIYSDDILQRITTTNLLKRMPVSRDPLPPELINLYRAWLEIGTPEFEENMVFLLEKKFLNGKTIL